MIGLSQEEQGFQGLDHDIHAGKILGHYLESIVCTGNPFSAKILALAAPFAVLSLSFRMMVTIEAPSPRVSKTGLVP